MTQPIESTTDETVLDTEAAPAEATFDIAGFLATLDTRIASIARYRAQIKKAKDDPEGLSDLLAALTTDAGRLRRQLRKSKSNWFIAPDAEDDSEAVTEAREAVNEELAEEGIELDTDS